MVVAFDYDETWTEAPDLFAAFAKALQAEGHLAIIVTSRDEARRPEGLPIPVYCTNLLGKREYMLDKHGIWVDIWVDDVPDAIVCDFYDGFADQG